MSKLLLLSLLVATIAIPVLAARAKSPRRGIKLTLFFGIAFFAFYVFAVKFIFLRIA